MNNNSKTNNIKSLRILRDDGKNRELYIDHVRGEIPLNIDFIIWNEDQYLTEINHLGIMSSDIYINTSEKCHFESLDDFMYYVRISDGETSEHIDKYPYKKERVLTKEEFVYYYKLYFQEIFSNNMTDLIKISFEKYVKGFFFFNEPSVIFLGCELEDNFWAFIYEPYI